MFYEKVLTGPGTGRNFAEKVVQKRANWLDNVFLALTNYFNYDLVLIDVSVVVLIDVSVVVNAQMAARFLATVAPLPNSFVPRGQIAKCNCRHFPDDPGHHPSWAFFCHRPIHLFFQFI